MLQKVKQTIYENRLFEDGECILVGVSGGADSIFLLQTLLQIGKERGWKLHVVHVEHGLRGEESIEDACFVQELCERLNIPFHLGKPDVKGYASQNRLSIEVAARELRYQFFQEVAHKTGAAKLALAHHADDQAETVLMRILRGTSLTGLAGIPLRRTMDGFEIVRPLLSIWKQEIIRYCSENNITYRTDSSNASTDFVRNKIRLQLLPHLESEYNKNIKRALVQLGEIASEEDQYMGEQAQSLLRDVVEDKSENRLTIQIDCFLKSPLALQRRVITLILYYLCGHTREWEAKHIDLILNLAHHTGPSTRIQLSSEILAWREYDKLHIGRKDELLVSTEKFETEILIPERLEDLPSKFLVFDIPELHLSGYMDLLKGAITPSNPWEIVFDYEEVRGKSFRIRTRHLGDVMQPLGMKGTKKLKEILMEARISRDRRNLWPIWELEDQIVWVTGIRRGSLGIVYSHTRLTLRIRVHNHSLTAK